MDGWSGFRCLEVDFEWDKLISVECKKETLNLNLVYGDKRTSLEMSTLKNRYKNTLLLKFTHLTDLTARLDSPDLNNLSVMLPNYGTQHLSALKWAKQFTQPKNKSKSTLALCPFKNLKLHDCLVRACTLHDLYTSFSFIKVPLLKRNKLLLLLLLLLFPKAV